MAAHSHEAPHDIIESRGSNLVSKSQFLKEDLGCAKIMNAVSSIITPNKL